MAGLPPAHRDALVFITGALRNATAPWWIIAGTAVALHARVPVAVGDIDVLIGSEDIPRVAALPGLRIRSGDGDDLFRSRFYAALETGGVEVEFMADFEVRRGTCREPVRPRSRVMLELGGGLSVPVPGRDELVAMLAQFGRDKDLARIALLNG